MKTIVFCLLLMYFFGGSDAIAQADLRVVPSTFSDGMMLDNPEVFARARNYGNQDSEPFVLKIWASVDEFFTEADEPVSYSFSGLDRCTRPGNPVLCPTTDYLYRDFKFPLVEEEVDPAERLPGDTRTPAQWIGERIYQQACISVNGGPFEGCLIRSLPVIPPVATPVSVVEVEPQDSMLLKWKFLPDGSGGSIAKHFRIRSIGHKLAETRQEIALEDVEVVSQANGEKVYSYVLNNITSGVEHRFIVYACVDDGGPELACHPFSGGINGFVYGQFFASQGASANQINLSWREYNFTTRGFAIRRCKKNNAFDCQMVANKVTGGTFTDSDVELGIRYIYEIFSCDSYPAGAGQNVSCNGTLTSTGKTNPGYTDIVDDFENDDNPSQATRVLDSVVQVHSLDSISDQDWLKLEVPTVQSVTIKTYGPVPADTEITLFNESVSAIDYSGNTPNVETRYAELETELLEPGTYYVKVNLQIVPGFEFLADPVEEYTLEVQMQGVGPVNLTPIINLLLDD